MSTKNIIISTEEDANRIVIDTSTGQERNERANPMLPYRSSDYSPEKIPGGIFPWHWHDEVECFYMVKGSLVYELQGGREIVFEEGDAGFINVGILHRTKPLDAPDVCQRIHVFLPQLIEPDRTSPLYLKYITPLSTNPAADIIRIPAADGDIGRLRNWMDKALVANTDRPNGYEFVIRGCMTHCWMRFLQEMPKIVRRADSSDSERLMEMIQYVETHFDRKITLEELAEAAHISAKECERCFKRQIHVSPIEYVVDYRLDRARQMLREESASITYIGLACGFASNSYFTKRFRAKYGMTPREYRKQKPE